MINSTFLLAGSLSVLAIMAIFFASVSIDDDSGDVSIQSASDDYSDICGYPVTDEMRLEIIRNEGSFTIDGTPYLDLHPGTFTHVERTQYLTDIPVLQYWFELKDNKQIYFEMAACDLDGSKMTLGVIGPNYQKPQDIIMDGVTYQILAAPGSPLIYKDTLMPVLDADNCTRIADNYTVEQREKLVTRENTLYGPVWENQIFPLMDYCTSIGNYELKTLDGNMDWSFTLLT